MTRALHIFRNPALLSEVRRSLADMIEPGARLGFNLNELEKQPLLLSIYAETLRFGVGIHVTHTWLAHTNEAVWNTKGGTFPLTSFWAECFLVDPNDPSSGPTKKPVRVPRKDEPKGDSAEGVAFSTEGLEGAWIPFRGGQHACPGRILAKRILLLAHARLIVEFDVEILAAEAMLQYASPRFGFGVRKPVGLVPFRIRRRKI
ncbi:hypothetical protein MMC11_002953 [Xylographa trunciseda]|nr:hypothetical protein [Xylographa trunciseda]